MDDGWIIVPCGSSGIVEPLQRCWSDMVALMVFEGWNQDLVLQRIESFLVCMACRAIVDMKRSGLY